MGSAGERQLPLLEEPFKLAMVGSLRKAGAALLNLLLVSKVDDAAGGVTAIRMGMGSRCWSHTCIYAGHVLSNEESFKLAMIG